MDFYRILPDDARYPDAWFLTEPITAGGRQLDAREFRYGRVYSGEAPAVVPIRKDGRRVAFHLAAFDMPVVTVEVANTLDQLASADIQRFPVTVGDGIAGYDIINAIRQRDCVDEEQSVVRKWLPEDRRPDKVGQYHVIDHLVIDPARTEGSHIFRLWGSEIELIASSETKVALEQIEDVGIVFQKVT